MIKHLVYVHNLSVKVIAYSRESQLHLSKILGKLFLLLEIRFLTHQEYTRIIYS